MDVVNLLETGLPQQCIDALMNRTGFTPGEISRVIHVTEKTLRRCRSRAEKNQLLRPLQSSQLWTLASIFTQAQYVLGNGRLALKWLRNCHAGLNGRSPLELLSTPIGIRAVRDFLDQIDSCVYI